MSNDPDKFKSNLQETVAACIILQNDNAAKAVRVIVDPSMFDRPLDKIVERALAFAKKFKEPPGKGHIDDILADVMSDDKNPDKKTYEIILKGLVTFEHMNTEYVLSEVETLAKLKSARNSIEKAAIRYNEGGDDVFEDLGKIGKELLKVKGVSKNYGFTLANPSSLSFLDRNEDVYCKIGIRQLDRYGVHPTKKEIIHLQAARNRGKSWFLGHCGKFGMLAGWNIIHYTLENSGEMTAQRYFQSLFSGAKRDENYFSYSFEHDKDGTPTGLSRLRIKPNFIIEHRDETREYLKKQQEKFIKLNNIRIREFPTGKLSIGQLEQDLDELELVEKFIPDMVLLDYPQMMTQDRKLNSHDSLLNILIDLRGLSVERNLAMVTAGQGNREGEDAATQRGSHSAGSIGIWNVVDNGITYSQTDSEEVLGLARIYAQKVRNDRARFTLVISQNYSTGQFCLSSNILTDPYKKLIKEAIKDNEWQDDDSSIEEEETNRRRVK